MNDYVVVLEQDAYDDLRYYTISVPAIPGLLSQGRTVPEALRSLAEAWELWHDIPGEPKVVIGTQIVTSTTNIEYTGT